MSVKDRNSDLSVSHFCSACAEVISQRINFALTVRADAMTSSIKRASSARAVTRARAVKRATLADGLKASCSERCEKSEQMAESLLDRKHETIGLKTVRKENKIERAVH